MATTIPRDPEFFLDGRKRSERVWTAGEAKGVPIMFATSDGGREAAAFGFSSEEAFETWLGKNGLAREYEKAKSILSRAPRTLSREQEQKARAQQVKRVEQYGAELKQVLRAAGISPDDGPAVVKFLTSYDPHTGPQIHSALLYEHTNLTGFRLYIPKGWACPDFGWFNFNDACSSAVAYFGGLILFEHVWYGGQRIGLYGWPAHWRNINGYPFYFNDTASSAITW